MPGTVVVYCKIPSGLRIQLTRMEEYQEPVMAGGVRTVKRAVPEGPMVKLNGCARNHNKETTTDIRFGCGVTYDVDADMFSEWMKRHRDEPYVRNGLVFAQPKPGDAAAQAKDHTSLKSGLEPLDPQNLPAELKNGLVKVTGA